MIPYDSDCLRKYRFELHGQPCFWRRKDLRQRHAARRQPAPLDKSATLQAVSDPENLLQVLDCMRHSGGPAPGIDGITYDDLGASEVASLVRGLSHELRSHTYSPLPARLLRKPKASGRGYRTIAIRVLLDRLVSAAVYEAVVTPLDALLLPGCWGGRPGRGPWQMLATLVAAIELNDAWAVTVDDIRDAFDHVRIDSVLEVMQRHIADDDLMRLFETVLRGCDPNRSVGVDQGDAMSMLALNFKLQRCHDLAIARDRSIPAWARYVDNLTYLTRTVRDGHAARETAARLLIPAGMCLKGEAGGEGKVADLRSGDSAQIMGVQLRQEQGKLSLHLGEKPWENLRSCLERMHEMQNPMTFTPAAVHGWISAYGMVSLEGEGTDFWRRIPQMLADHGLLEVYHPEEARNVRRGARKRWRACLRDAYAGMRESASLS